MTVLAFLRKLLEDRFGSVVPLEVVVALVPVVADLYLDGDRTLTDETKFDLMRRFDSVLLQAGLIRGV